MADVKVEQCDREMAKPFFNEGGAAFPMLAEAFARHRQAAEKATREECTGIVKAVTQANVQARIDRADDKLAFEFQGLGDVIATAIRNQNDG